MKYILIFIFVFLSMYCVLLSQKCTNILPVSKYYSTVDKKITKKENIENINLYKVNIDSLNNYEKKFDSLGIGRPYRFGYGFDVNYNMHDVGTWDTLDNGNYLWRLKIICKNAYSINLIYSKFHLSKHALFFLYNNNQDHLLGAFNYENNKSHKKFATDLIKGDTTILEMFIPKSELKFNQLIISKIVYGYKDLFAIEETYLNEDKKDKNKLQNTDCDDEVNCAIGDDWCREKLSVSRILIDGDHLCTGALLNNTSEDYTPYYLTATHCVTGFDPDVWVFQFGYMFENCNGGMTLKTYSYTGADVLVTMNDLDGDISLLELQERPKSGEHNFPDVFFNGWDVTGNIPNNSTLLHHRLGERMKIAMDYDSPTSLWGYDSKLKSILDFGWVSYGSSGAPIFTSNGKVIGASSYASLNQECSVPQYLDFGKMSYSWNRLSSYLDPEDLNTLIWDGIKLPRLIYGLMLIDGNNFTEYAYDVFKIGSNSFIPCRIESGAVLNMQAGKEIHIRPCTHFESGSEYHGFIEDIDCDDVVMLSDKESDYDPYNCGGSMLKQSLPNNMTNEYTDCSISIVPNPLSEITTITISLTNSSNITLAVFDMLGNKIHEFTNNEFTKAGRHKFTLNAANIPSGMYYVHLISQDAVLTEPLIIAK